MHATMETFVSSAAFMQGLLMTGGLIIAIGAQNALVLRQGLLRLHVGPVIALCIASDWLLIALGVFGLGSVIQSSTLLLQVFRFGGAGFLFWYGSTAALRAWRPPVAGLQSSGTSMGLKATLGTALAMTYLNPHVYLDTVVLLGSVGAQQPAESRPAFVTGAGVASLLWFLTLGYGAVAAGRWLQRPAVWRGIDACVAIIMFLTAAQLLLKPI